MSSVYNFNNEATLYYNLPVCRPYSVLRDLNSVILFTGLFSLENTEVFSAINIVPSK